MHRSGLLVCFTGCIAFMLGSTVYALDDLPKSAQDAYAAYAEGDFVKAEELYGKLTWEAGAQDASLWYNMGNAHARAGRRGAAIAAYRRALELRPGHADAAANLDYLRAQVGVQRPAPDQRFIAWLVQPATWLPAHTWMRLSAGTWAALWLAAAVAVWRRRMWRRLAAGATLLCILSLGGWGAVRLARSLQPRAIVISTVAPLRTGPGSDYLVTYSLPDGAELTLLTRQAGWVQLRLSDGATGWTEADRVWVLPVSDPRPGWAPPHWAESTAP